MARATPRTIFLSAAAACALAAPGAAGAERLFATGAAFPLEEPAVAIALDDFDRDGRLDAAALGLPGVSVLLAGPEGTFLEPRVHPAGLGPAALASGDFTGDGAPDIVVANGGSSTLSVLLNRGAGAFAPAGDVAVGLGPRALALADFDGDGRLDVASSNLRARTVDVRLGDGAGGFPAGQVLQAGDNPHDLTSGDFDGDGAADLAVAHTGAVSWFRGLGDGSFAPPADTPVAPDPRSLATGDLLGDGALDLGAIDDAGGIFALENLGGGKFRDELAGWLTSRGFQGLLGAVQVADFDADGAPDLIATDLQGAESALRVFRRREGGAFGEAPSVHLGVQAGVAVCRDATGDGLLEVLAARSDSAELVLFEGIAPGRVAARTVISLEGGPRGVAALDADRDGVADLVAYSSDGLHLVLGSPAGLEPPVLERIAGAAFQDMTSGDFDGDGRADLALADLALDEARVLLLGDGGQARATRRHPLSGLPSQIAAADLDGDGWADLVAGDQVQTAAMVLFRPGEEQPPPALDLETGGGQTALAIGDLDGDGSLDVAAAGRVGVRLFLGDGARGFPRTRDAGALATSRALRVADLDSDGIGDLVGVSRSTVVILHAPGSPGASRATTVDLGAEVRPLEVADADLDGLLDLVTASWATLLVARGEPGGGFAEPEAYLVGQSPRGIVLRDLDSDGILDAVTADYGARSLSLLHGASRAGPGAFAFRRGDADSSGALDLTDAVAILGALFRGAGPLPCPDAADSNDDGALNLTDAVAILLHLFAGGPAPPTPGPEACGRDPSADGLEACAAPCR